MMRMASLLVAVSLLTSAATAQERIVSKPDADMTVRRLIVGRSLMAPAELASKEIFAFTRAEWERYLRQVATKRTLLHR